MPITPEDRPLQQVKDEAIDKLIANYAHSRLSMQAFERRLDAINAAENAAEVISQIEDLEEIDLSPYEQFKEKSLGVKYSSKPDKESRTLVSIFGGNTMSGHFVVPKEIRVFCLFGGTDIDLSDAAYHYGETNIQVYCIFGGVDISVPPEVNVVSHAFSVFGGIDNNAPSMGDRESPSIIVDGFVLFGGIDISIRQTLREKLVAFADKVKSMLN